MANKNVLRKNQKLRLVLCRLVREANTWKRHHPIMVRSLLFLSNINVQQVYTCAF